MRPPFEGVISAEPLSKWKMAAIGAAGLALSFAIAAGIVASGTFAYFEPAIRFLAWPLSENWYLHIALHRLANTLLTVAFANVFVAYLILKLVNSAELRTLMRWALHASIWMFLLNLASSVWIVTSRL